MYKCSIARKGMKQMIMDEMISRKNELLIRNGKRMEEIHKIAQELIKANPGEPWLKLSVNSLGEKINRLTLWYDDMITEGNIYLPEAEDDALTVPIEDQPTEEEIARVREENGDD